MKYITFPWEQMGQILRALSLSGSAGNAAAWILFLAIGALPLALTAFLTAGHRFRRPDILLFILSAVLYASLWLYTNPTYMALYLSPIPMGEFSKYIPGAAIYSVFLTWLLLHCLNHYEKPERHKLLSGLRILLGIYVLFLAVSAFWQGGMDLFSACRTLSEHNTGADRLQLNVSTFFLVLQAFTDLLPVMAEIALLLMVNLFLHSFEKDAFGAKTCARLEQLKTSSGRLLILILLTNVSFTLLQLLFSRFLLSTSYLILFPLPEIIVVLGIRILSLLYLESKRLKEDNDMFI